jgi:beta-glucosidase/6-phospho-beta-glucosidase/beta-galactosidase
VDLCHFGVPDWLGDFQNPDFPKLFARYARDFSERFPWVQLYTPVNEMYICAMFSGRLGFWNEQGTTDRTFVTALKHVVLANIMAMQEILEVRPDALFIQSESSEYFHAEEPGAARRADIYNAERFLTLDLNYSRPVNSYMYEYLRSNGMTAEEYEYCMTTRLKPHCIMGNDYYWTNEHRVPVEGKHSAAGEVFGYYEITRQYYDRYRLPVMHTETNFVEKERGDEAVNWLWKQWSNLIAVRNSGVPVVGFTWYSLHDQIDWDIALRKKTGNIHAVGLYDLDRNIRPAGIAYKQIIEQWRHVLPAQSACLQLPIVEADEWEEPWAVRRREQMRELRRAGGEPRL